MYRFIAILPLLIFAQELPGQQPSDSLKNQIGINLYSLRMPHDIVNSDENVNGAAFNHNLMGGIVYKRYSKQFTFRFAADYQEQYESRDNVDQALNKTDHFGMYKGFVASAGLEFKMLSGSVQPFIGNDFYFSFGESDGIRRSRMLGDDRDYHYKIKGFGFGPVVGVQVFPYHNFSFTAEANANFAKLIYDNGEEVSGVTHRYLNPLRLLSVNWHF